MMNSRDSACNNNKASQSSANKQGNKKLEKQCLVPKRNIPNIPHVISSNKFSKSQQTPTNSQWKKTQQQQKIPEFKQNPPTNFVKHRKKTDKVFLSDYSSNKSSINTDQSKGKQAIKSPTKKQKRQPIRQEMKSQKKLSNKQSKAQPSNQQIKLKQQKLKKQSNDQAMIQQKKQVIKLQKLSEYKQLLDILKNAVKSKDRRYKYLENLYCWMDASYVKIIQSIQEQISYTFYLDKLGREYQARRKLLQMDLQTSKKQFNSLKAQWLERSRKYRDAIKNKDPNKEELRQISETTQQRYGIVRTQFGNLQTALSDLEKQIEQLNQRKREQQKRHKQLLREKKILSLQEKTQQKIYDYIQLLKRTDLLPLEKELKIQRQRLNSLISQQQEAQKKLLKAKIQNVSLDKIKVQQDFKANTQKKKTQIQSRIEEIQSQLEKHQ